MFFNSLHYAFFFLVVFSLAKPLRRRIRTRNAMLLVASYYFYACWDWRFLSLILISTMVDYVCGRLLDVGDSDLDQPPARSGRDRWVLFASVATNLGLLGFFKYFDFFITSAVPLLKQLGIPASASTLNVILPVGISFYTFQTLSYTIDAYRGRMPVERNLLNFALFVAFFPQLVAGPIERASRLLPQIRTRRDTTWTHLYTGFYLICWGLFKKVVVADQIATVADAVFRADQTSTLEVIVGVYAFAIQIYCDFSGYSDIARGSARCLGFDLMLNFNLPYFATNPIDFWRRWHISLSTWLRDYLYIPLGGNKMGSRRTYINLMLTMVLGGLWHGAAWTFVLWGLYQGLLLCGYRMIMSRPTAGSGNTARPALGLGHWLRVAGFFQLVCLGWLLFRAESVEQVWRMTDALLFNLDFSPRALKLNDIMVFLTCAILFFGVQLIQWHKGDLKFVLRLPLLPRAAVYAAGILGFIFFGSEGGQAFIYFQF